MANFTNVTQLFNPTDKATDRPITVRSRQHAERMAEQLVTQLQSSDKDLTAVPVIHRKTGECRWFNLSQNETESYPGAYSNAGALLCGEWRYATAEEEAAAIQANVAERAALDRAAERAASLPSERAAERASDRAVEKMVTIMGAEGKLASANAKGKRE